MASDAVTLLYIPQITGVVAKSVFKKFFLKSTL